MTAFAYSQNHEETPLNLVIENAMLSPQVMKTCIFNSMVRQKNIMDMNRILQSSSCTDMCNTFRCD